jgi:prevent-host-death family protein
MDTMNLADAKARFSELVDRVSADDTVDILGRGKAVARLTPVHNPRDPVDLALMRALNPDPVRAVAARGRVRARNA